MNKQELIRKISEDTNLTQKQASAALDSVLDAIVDAVKIHEKVQLVGFGTFEAKQRNARIGRNPKTGVEVPITPRRILSFRPSQILKKQVNAKK